MSPRKSPSAVYRMLNTRRWADLRSALWGLDGLPVGGWPETVQARSRIRDELPWGYTLADVERAVVVIDANDRYRVTIGGES